MGKEIITAILTTALGVIPLASAAASSQTQPSTQAKHASTSAPGTHATRGIVKSVDATTLVITRADKKGSVMTFTLNPSTNRPEGVAVGTPVSVRYREEGKAHVATAVTVQQSKSQAAHQAPSKG
jgi:hypothetical protein